MAQGKFHLATIKPRVEVLGNTVYTADDILFDWHAFEVPKGGFCIKTLTAVVAGLDKVATAGVDVELFFAKSLNGVAPTSLGAANGATSLIACNANRNHIIGRQYLDASALEDGDRLVGYNVWAGGGGGVTGLGTAKLNDINLVMEGDPNYAGTTSGYQTIWIAAFTIGTPNHGTTVLLNQAGNQAISTTSVALVTDGGDADDVFGIGDEIMAYAADGSSPSIVGTVTAVAANLLTVDKVEEAFTDDDELCFRAPYIFHLGLEY